MIAVADAAATDPRIRLVINDDDGATTKGACLNRIWRRVADDAATGGFSADALVLHDAEDMVDAAAPAVIAGALAGCDYVQLPVLALGGGGPDWVGGHYSDEFAEAHLKDMPVRSALGAALPTSGVGCAFRITALAAIAGRDGPFAADSLVEDYELGLRLSARGYRGRFVRARDDDGRLVATRALFPATLAASVRQEDALAARHRARRLGTDRLAGRQPCARRDDVDAVARPADGARRARHRAGVSGGRAVAHRATDGRCDAARRPGGADAVPRQFRAARMAGWRGAGFAALTSMAGDRGCGRCRARSSPILSCCARHGARSGCIGRAPMDSRRCGTRPRTASRARRFTPAHAGRAADMRRSAPTMLIVAACGVWLSGRGVAVLLLSAGPEPPRVVASAPAAEVAPPVRAVRSPIARGAAIAQGVAEVVVRPTVAAPPPLHFPPEVARIAATAARGAATIAASSAGLEAINRQLLANLLAPSRDYRMAGESAAAVPWAAARGESPLAAGQFAAAPTASTRWSLSAWLALRPDGQLATAIVQPLLGGSQAGARLDYALDRERRIGVYARLVSAGRIGDGAEGALGIAIAPAARVPLTLAVERRQRLAGSAGRSAWAMIASGGVSEMPVHGDWRADGYGAAGVVGLHDPAAFVEAAVTIRRPLVQLGRIRIGAGVGAWGAAQPGTARLDVGPGHRRRSGSGGAARVGRLAAAYRRQCGARIGPGAYRRLELLGGDRIELEAG